MNILKNIYGKLAVFYVVVACVMVYLAFSYEKKISSLDDFYNDNVMEFAPHASSNGTITQSASEEASLT